MIRKLLLAALMVSSIGARAQDDLDAEFEAFDEPAPPMQEMETITPTAQTPTTTLPYREPEPEYVRPAPKHVTVEEEMRLQRQILARKKSEEVFVGSGPNVDRYPQEKPLFKKPAGPKQGGTVRMEHPSAAKGLLRINRDGTYQYRTSTKPKSASGSFGIAMITPPKIASATGSTNFETMYGSNNLYAATFSYEWQPFRGFGSLGLQLGAGITSVTAKGYFKNPNPTRPARAQESYNLFIVPLSAFINYRLEYFTRQWVVPYISGGGIYYGMAEVRNDGKSPVVAGAPAVGGGGGLLFNISRLDSAGAFSLAEEYGVADLWLMVQARAMKGLNTDTDFTNQTVEAGIAVDF